MSYLLVATAARSWGEVVFARGLAEELRARGDRVVALAPADLVPALRGAVDRLGVLDRVLENLPAALPGVAREAGCEVVVLVDLATVFMHLESRGHDAALLPALDAAGLSVAALDVWDLAASELRWDFGDEHGWSHSPRVRDVAARICPVPLASPTTPSGYCAIGPCNPDDGADQVLARARVGGSATSPIVFLATAGWQLPPVQNFEANRQLAARLPALVGALLAATSPTLTVVHVGPESLPGLADALGARYRWRPPCPPDEFTSLLGAADLLITPNLAATTITAAIARGVPVLALQHSPHVDAPRPGGIVARWRAEGGPDLAFRVWPMGLHEFLSAALVDNPFATAITQVEVFEEDAVIEAVRGLTTDSAARRGALDRQAAYARAVRALPSAATALDRALSTVGSGR